MISVIANIFDPFCLLGPVLVAVRHSQGISCEFRSGAVFFLCFICMTLVSETLTPCLLKGTLAHSILSHLSLLCGQMGRSSCHWQNMGLTCFLFFFLIISFSFTDAIWWPCSVLISVGGLLTCLQHVQLVNHLEIPPCERHFMIQTRGFQAVVFMSQVTSKSFVQSSGCHYPICFLPPLMVMVCSNPSTAPRKRAPKKEEKSHIQILFLRHGCFPQITVQLNIV